jgi:hypothetical protein
MTPDRFRAAAARQTELERAAGQRVETTGSSYPKLVGSVFGNPTVPTSTGAYFSVHPVDVAGTEGEGSPGTLLVDTSRSLLVYVIGSKAPAAGDYLVCRFVGHRWVAERFAKTPPGVLIPGCPCASVPRTLQMSVSNPNLNNRIFQPATLQYYSPVPPQFSALALGSFAFLSTTSFTDDLSTSPFWYYFTCFQGSYALTRVYPKTGTGQPFRDSIRYRWSVVAPGNSCSPFLLNNGTIYTGGNPACVVTISE